ncbi:hypothetical protein Agabi119p4_5275 [Agaricus bisporus var. burnettii]|uniref:Uncharacterized protein n=1 Tax=Agaricus bisporus var. burnettii TaxID=192524 RepID=A0A8H7F1D5_AGABI|nr:hypothetical protein Agabi119p4_5275 [Agaricus bisporus var. burnettii]
MAESVHTSELPVRIVTGPKDSEVWAWSFLPKEHDKPPFFNNIYFENNPAGVFDRWQVKRFEDGFTFLNEGNGLWACAKDGEVFTSNEFNASHCKWLFESTGRGIIYNIKVPNQDLVWTMKRRDPDQKYPTLFLAPADGNPNQEFYFSRILD